MISVNWVFRCSWWFGRTQNKATTWQSGIFCGWSGRLERSPTGHSFGTYIINVQKHAQDTSVLSFLLHWLFPEYEQQTLYGVLVVTFAILLCLIYCRFIIFINNDIFVLIMTRVTLQALNKSYWKRTPDEVRLQAASKNTSVVSGLRRPEDGSGGLSTDVGS